jgi:hypothetical protein
MMLNADLGMGVEMIKDIAKQVSERAPIGELWAGKAADKNYGAKVMDVYNAWSRSIKRGLVFGGPNALAAAAVTLTAMGHTMDPAVLGSIFTGFFAMTVIPRLPGYFTNAFGMMAYQMPAILGPRATLGTFKSAVEAGQATSWPVHFNGIAEATRNAMNFFAWFYKGPSRGAPDTARILEQTRDEMRRAIARGDPQGQPGGMVFTTKDGRVYSTGAVVIRAHGLGLDGTQANFESAQIFATRMRKLLEEEAASQTMWGRMAQFVKQVGMGDTELSAIYQTAYNMSDTFFRYAMVIQGLKDGLPEHEAVQRALMAAFDYSAMSPLDVTLNKIILFWMFTRRTVDLTLWTLWNHPDRMLGVLRVLRGQMAVNSYGTYSSVEEEQPREVLLGRPELQPTSAMGRPAITFIPAHGYGTQANKMLLPETPVATTLTLLNDIMNLDVAGIAARIVPPGPLVLSSIPGGEVWSPMRKKFLDDPIYFEVPASIVRFDQAHGGALSAAYGFRAIYKPDGMHWYALNFEKWDALKTSVPNLTTILTIADAYDRAGIPIPLEWIGAQDTAADAAYVQPQDLGPRESVGGVAELWRAYLGIGTAPIATPYAAEEAIRRAAVQRVEEATEKIRPTYPEPTPQIPMYELGAKPGTLTTNPEDRKLGTTKEAR